MHFFGTTLTVISRAQLKCTFRTNSLSFFVITKTTLKHLREGSAVVKALLSLFVVEACI
jgi:hypothetical protein